MRPALLLSNPISAVVLVKLYFRFCRHVAFKGRNYVAYCRTRSNVNVSLSSLFLDLE